MRTFLLSLAFIGVLIVATLFWMGLERWKPTACKCGRERNPWFGRRHMKEWMMALIIVMFVGFAIYGALAGNSRITPIVNGLWAVWHARTLYEHRKGKRSILGRLLGRVVVTEHGRLAVQN